MFVYDWFLLHVLIQLVFVNTRTWGNLAPTGHQKVFHGQCSRPQGPQSLSSVWFISDLTEDKEMLGNKRQISKLCLFLSCPEFTGMLFQVRRLSGSETAPRPSTPLPKGRVKLSQGPAQCTEEAHLCAEEGITQGSSPNDMDCPPPCSQPQG